MRNKSRNLQIDLSRLRVSFSAIRDPRLCGASRLALSCFLIGIASICFSGCGRSSTNAGTAEASKKRPQAPAPVRVESVVRRDVSPRVVVIGSVVPERTSVVASGANGVVEEFNVKEGQLVEAGHVLCVLRMVTTDLGIQEARDVLTERKQAWEELKNGFREEEVNEARAKMLAAQALMDSTAARFQRIKRLFAQNAASQDDLEAAEEKADGSAQLYQAALARFQLFVKGPRAEQIAQAEARFNAQQAHVQFLIAEKQKRTTRAPFDGYIVQEQTQQGQWLSKGDPVATLARLSEVDVVANVDEKDIHHIQLGQQAQVRVHARQQTDWTGRVWYVVPRSEWKSGSRGFPVKVRLTNQFVPASQEKKTPVLKEGMMARVTLEGQPVSVLLVSKDAIVRSSNGTIVYLYEPDERNGGSGTVRPLPVAEGIEEGADVQVIADDLEAGMQVVVEGAERLRPFQRVQLLRKTAAATNR